MRLARFSVENYRAFVDRVTLELRPLTLLFGYNSAGKSALLRFLPILGASSSPGQLAPLALDTAAARGASFRDLLSRQGASSTLQFGLEWEGAGSPLAVDLRVLDIPERQLQVVERLSITHGTSEFSAIWNAADDSITSRAREYETSLGSADSLEPGVGLPTVPIGFEGVAPAVKWTGDIRSYLDQAAEALRGLREQVHWLNSLRAVHPRSSRFGIPPSRISPDGSNAGDYLAHDRLAEGELVRRVSAIFEKATGHRLEVTSYAVAGENNTRS